MNESEPNHPKRKIAIAGATGFIGQALIPELQDWEIIGLSRFPRENDSSSVEWRTGNLFSLLDAERMIASATHAVYLVHSMLPSARLSQGSFQDFDAILADNFVRACVKAGVKHIIYLGGLIPDNDPSLSKHLASRLEVERILKSYGIPVTALRAGMIIGPRSSSFDMVYQLVLKLPFMLCPAWTQNQMQPTSIETVVKSISYCLTEKETLNKTFDLGGPEHVSYQKLLETTAEKMGLKRSFLSVPLVTPTISTFWVSLITKAPFDLVKPLVESLQHSMVGHPDRKLRIPGYQPEGFEEYLERSVQQKINKKTAMPRAYEKRPRPKGFKGVSSVTRLSLPDGWNAENAADEYMKWLPERLPFKVFKNTLSEIHFGIKFMPFSLLIIKIDSTRSTPDRQLFRIRGGFLSSLQPEGSEPHGRLEFRQIPNQKELLVAIHDYEPRLPWLIYRWTQAILHLWVMGSFCRHIFKLANQKKPK